MNLMEIEMTGFLAMIVEAKNSVLRELVFCPVGAVSLLDY